MSTYTHLLQQARGRLRARTFEGHAKTATEATETASQILDYYQLHNETATIEQTHVHTERDRSAAPAKRHYTALTITYRDPQEDRDDDDLTGIYYGRPPTEWTPSELETHAEIDMRQAQRDHSYLRTYYDDVHEHPKAAPGGHPR